MIWLNNFSNFSKKVFLKECKGVVFRWVNIESIFVFRFKCYWKVWNSFF